jgi:hypothetical protein
MSEVLQHFRIGYQRCNTFWSNVSINDRVNQRRARLFHHLWALVPSANRATSCFFSDARIEGKSMRELSAALLPDRSATVNRQNEKYGDAP